uniref:DUF4179 domain-containing protein n=1 Tax=Acetivibrio cellulolyticus TaxID=35830 RepID=UPI0001E2CC42|nr:DUF4179 domain-containing protein [Acetivibrio cellulolyticus]
MGYEDVISGSLKKINDEGRGQKINKSCTFSNGIKVTVDGIVFDDNVMEVFCKYENLKEDLDVSSLSLGLSGIKPFGYFCNSSGGTFIDDRRNCFFVYDFEPPKFYEKWMKLNVRYLKNGLIEEKSIRFTLDRNKALNKTVEKSLKKKVKVGDYAIMFDKITASSMTTYAKGRLEGLSDSAKEVLKDKPPINTNGERVREMPRVNFDISTDKGESIEIYGSEMSNRFGKISFTNRGDAIPENFESLEIKNIRLESMLIVDKRVDVSIGKKEIKVNDDLVIKNVYYEGENTCVVVSSKGIAVMGLMDGNEFMDMVDPNAFDREAESPNAVDRIYRFKGKGENMKLEIKCINYSTYSDEVLEIPLD